MSIIIQFPCEQGPYKVVSGSKQRLKITMWNVNPSFHPLTALRSTSTHNHDSSLAEQKEGFEKYMRMVINVPNAKRKPRKSKDMRSSVKKQMVIAGIISAENAYKYYHIILLYKKNGN